MNSSVYHSRLELFYGELVSPRGIISIPCNYRLFLPPSEKDLKYIAKVKTIRLLRQF